VGFNYISQEGNMHVDQMAQHAYLTQTTFISSPSRL